MGLPDAPLKDRVPWAVLGLALLVTFLGYLSYVHRYWEPPYLFWDENYHVASAQRYLHGTFFMEPHPPLGKLLIALGEATVSPEANGASDQFLGTDHAPETPAGFSFVGYRLFPTLLAWLVGPMLFFVFMLLTKNPVFAALLTLPYLFDNALIVHSRSAMLEPILIFFAVAMILLFLILMRWRSNRKCLRVCSLLLGACFAAVITTKVTGLVMGLLYLPLLWGLLQGDDRWRSILDSIALNIIGFVIVFVAVWQTHFALGSTVDASLPEQGFYQASEEYKEILRDGENGSLRHFGVMLRDSMAFVGHYQKGVPKLDLCKEGENGSPWFLWPIGARAINYRWETEGGDESALYQYLYLQSNPVGWFLGLTGVFLAAVLLVASFLLPLRRPVENRSMLMVFFGLWVAYMVAISQLDRVMYLYHYFLPLLFSYVLFGLVVVEIREIAGRRVGDRQRLGLLMLCAALVLGGFWFYRPLTYYQPITDTDFMKRSLVRVWDLHCVRCDLTSTLVRRACP